MAKYQINNVKQFKSYIRSKGFTYKEFIRQVADLSGKTEATITGYVYGASRPDADAITAFAIILKTTNHKIESLITPKQRRAKKTASPQSKQPRKKIGSLSNYLDVNTTALAKAMEGKSSSVVEKQAGLYKGWVWKITKGMRRATKEDLEKVAYILGINVDDLIEKDTNSKSAKNKTDMPMSDTNQTIETDNNRIMISAAEATNEIAKNIHPIPTKAETVADLCNTVMANVTTLAHSINALLSMVSATFSQSADTTDSTVLTQLTDLNSRTEQIETFLAKTFNLPVVNATPSATPVADTNHTAPADTTATPAKETKPKQAPQTKHSSPKVKVDKPAVKTEPVNIKITPRGQKVNSPISIHNLKYDSHDTLEEYTRKINAIIRIISDRTGYISNQIRHDAYDKLNRAYGWVELQAKKEYKARHNGECPKYTLPLIHDDPTFAEIFFNILLSRAASKRPEDA